MKKIDFFFEDLMFSLRCNDEDAQELLSLGNDFLDKAKQNKKSFPTLSSKNLIFLSALLILAKNREYQEPDAVYVSSRGDDFTSYETPFFDENEIVGKLSAILHKIESIKNTVEEDLFVK